MPQFSLRLEVIHAIESVHFVDVKVLVYMKTYGLFKNIIGMRVIKGWYCLVLISSKS